jgi:uncharacterized protein
MLLRLSNVIIRFDAPLPDAVERELRARLGRHADSLASWRVVRRAIDARKKPPRLVLTVEIEVPQGAALTLDGAIPPPPRTPLRVDPGGERFPGRPLVAGAGPAGLFAALLLAEHGYRPLLIDRGGTTSQRLAAMRRLGESRVPEPECNALFGLGGAGAFSDGKLATSLGDGWIPEILRVLVECGAPPEILVDAKPHVGTDLLPGVVSRLVARIEAAGGIVQPGVRAEDLNVRDGRIAGVRTADATVDTGVALLAIGHSARDTWEMLATRGVALEPKPFQMGVRAEHPQAWLDTRQYGPAAGHPALGAADYKLTARPGGVPVFSFCMCPGGETMPTINEPGRLCVNGMSESARSSPYASSGLVVTLLPEAFGGRDLASCLTFVRGVEERCFAAGGADYSAPAQRLREFAEAGAKRPAALPSTSYRLGVVPVQLESILPRCVVEPLRGAMPRFERAIPGYVHPEAVLLAPESRASSPVRITRDPVSRESVSVGGLYPVGEGAGYAGGIVSAALDGLRSARIVIEKYAPPTS